MVSMARAMNIREPKVIKLYKLDSTDLDKISL